MPNIINDAADFAAEIKQPENQIEIAKRLSAYSAWLRGENRD